MFRQSVRTLPIRTCTSILILPRFWASYDRGLALGMYLHDAINLVAMRQWTKGYADGGMTALIDRTMTASY